MMKTYCQKMADYILLTPFFIYYLISLISPQCLLESLARRSQKKAMLWVNNITYLAEISFKPLAVSTNRTMASLSGENIVKDLPVTSWAFT